MWNVFDKVQEKMWKFLGFIISLQSVIDIYENYYENWGGTLLTYKLCQDHLETYFSAVRSKGGNNNQSFFQFLNIYKRLLVHVYIKSSINANCLTLDTTEILKVTEELFNLPFEDMKCDDH